MFNSSGFVNANHELIQMRISGLITFHDFEIQRLINSFNLY